MSSYIPIASQTLGSSASSVTFSSIPTTLNGKTLRDLVIVCSNVTTDVAGKQITIRFNGDSGSNYNWVRMSGDGSSASSAAVSSFSSIWLTEGAATSDTERQQTIIQVLDFAQTDKHKSLISRAGQSAAGTNALAGRWASTSAVTSVALPLTSGNYNAGSTFSLYGLEG